MAIFRKEAPQTVRPVEGEMSPLAELEHFTPKYWHARQALEKATSIDEVLQVRNLADAARVYAAQAHDDEMMRMASDIKLRAQRCAGEKLRELEKARGGEKYHRSMPSTSAAPETSAPAKTPTLKDIGVSKDESADWQKLAKVPDSDFEGALEEAKTAKLPVSSAASLLKQVERAKAANIADHGRLLKAAKASAEHTTEARTEPMDGAGQPAAREPDEVIAPHRPPPTADARITALVPRLESAVKALDSIADLAPKESTFAKHLAHDLRALIQRVVFDGSVQSHEQEVLIDKHAIDVTGR